MKHIFLTAIIAALAAGPAFAADPDSHAAHHPQAAAAPVPAPVPQKRNTAQAGMMDKCPMMQGSGGTKPMDCSSMMKVRPDSKSKDH